MYLLETPHEKYVVRLARNTERSRDSLQFELEWLEYLHANDIPVSYPIRLRDGRLYCTIRAPEGVRSLAVFTYAEGATDLTVDRARLLGEALAKLHIQSDQFESQYSAANLDTYHLVQEPIEKIQAFIQDPLDPKSLLLDKVQLELTEKLEALNLSEGAYGIVTGDMHGENQHFTSDDQLTMFDFEFCSYGYRMYDVATFLWNQEDNALCDAFLEGYQSIRAISEDEFSSIKLFVHARQLWWISKRLSVPECYVDEQFLEKALKSLLSLRD